MILAEPVIPKVAVVNLNQYSPHGGVGRVLNSLLPYWQSQLEVSKASLSHVPLPLLRNVPVGVHTEPGSQLVLFPQLTGALALRRFQALPSLVIVHDVGIVDFPADGDKRDPIGAFLVEQSFYALKRASHVVTVSNFSKGRLLAHLPDLSGRVTAIPNGVDDTFLAFSQTKVEARRWLEGRLSTIFEGPLLIYVGSEIKRKNLSFLLDVLKQLKTAHPRLRLLKVGGPGHERWREATLEKMRQRGLRTTEDVVFLEGLSDAELAAAYRAADVFVSASLYEGFGLPALEAMAVGTSVVVANTSAFPEVVGSCGCAIAPEVNTFVSAVDETLEKPYSEGALKARARHFSWQTSAQQYLQVIAALI